MEKLTTRQEFILKAIKKLIAENGYPPTVREIGKLTNLSSPATIHFHIEKLAEKGYIKKDSTKNRTLELLVPNEYLEQNEDVIKVPLLGKVTAGTPIEAIETPDEVFSLPRELIPKNKEILIVERTNVAKNGDTVVAMNEDNEATVKTFYKENGYFRLQPENDTMQPIILKTVTILGKVIGLYRKF